MRWILIEIIIFEALYSTPYSKYVSLNYIMLSQQGAELIHSTLIYTYSKDWLRNMSFLFKVQKIYKLKIKPCTSFTVISTLCNMLKFSIDDYGGFKQ